MGPPGANTVTWVWEWGKRRGDPTGMDMISVCFLRVARAHLRYYTGVRAGYC